MRQRRYYKRRKGKKRGRGIPYIYKSKIYLGKKPQTGSGGFLESSHVSQKTLETLLDFKVQKEI